MVFGFRKKSQQEKTIEFIEREEQIEILEAKAKGREAESEQKQKLAKLKKEEFLAGPFGGVVLGAKTAGKTADDIIKVAKPLAKNIISGIDSIFPKGSSGPPPTKKKKSGKMFSGGF